MTDTIDRHAALREQIAALDKADAALDKAMKPFRAAQREIVAARELLLEAHQAEVAGVCEECGKILFAGEQGHSCAEGELFCSAHAPTYGDWQAQLDDEARAGDEDGTVAEGRRTIADHLAGGGNLGDRILTEL
jgi:hypothetical protein